MNMPRRMPAREAGESGVTTSTAMPIEPDGSSVARNIHNPVSVTSSPARDLISGPLT